MSLQRVSELQEESELSFSQDNLITFFQSFQAYKLHCSCIWPKVDLKLNCL